MTGGTAEHEAETGMLVEITENTHEVQLDIRYATDDNITGRPIYARPVCYLNPEAETLLRRAIDLARPLGLRLKLFDAFRPSEAQWRLWNFRPDPEFLA